MDVSEKIKQHIIAEIINRKDILEYIDENLEFKIKNQHIKGRHFIVDSLPECGKDFLKSLMINLTGFEEADWHHTFNNQTSINLYYPKIVDSYSKNLVINGLCPLPWAYDIDILKRFNIDAIFIVRDIADIIASLREFYFKRLRSPEYISLDSLGFYSMPVEQQFDIVIEMDLALIVRQYATWYRAKQDLGLNFMFISYDDLIMNSFEISGLILEYFKLSKSDKEIKIAIEKANAQESNNSCIAINNKYIGKGASLLTDSQKQRINDFISLYKNLEFRVETDKEPSSALTDIQKQNIKIFESFYKR